MTIKLIKRMKNIFETKLGLTFQNKETGTRYGKSDPCIVMVWTPNNPGGLFYQIEQEAEDTCLYKRLKMDYHYGLRKIYTQEEIDKAKQSPGFDREYGLEYLGKVGNVFSEIQIQKAIDLGDKYSLAKIPINNFTNNSIGVDIGFGSSKKNRKKYRSSCNRISKRRSRFVVLIFFISP